MVSCGNNGVNNHESTPVIMPLAIGNSWTSERLATDSLGDTLWIDTCTSRIASYSNIDSEIWFKLVSNCGKVGHKTNRKDGLWTKLDSIELNLTAKYPADVGYRWTNSDSSTEYIVVTTDTMIMVPTGTFKCYGYRWGDVSDSNSFGINYYSPDIGIVMNKYWPHGLSGNNEQTNRLIALNLNLN